MGQQSIHERSVKIMSWVEFWHMGGYAFYVWTSWGLTALVMLWLVGSAKLRRKKLITELSTKAKRAAVATQVKD